MRSAFKLALVFLSLLTPIGSLAARTAATDDYSETVLLSPEQGEALAALALQSERRIRYKPDCSHLVHLLYARAGLNYAYEDSRVLYRGISDFQRVKAPQPGDLVVWLGHVGVVLSPQEKTFLSSVRSGVLTESWMAPHWVRRGRPRFYRYRIGPAADMNLLASVMRDHTLPSTGNLTSKPDATMAELPSPDSRTESEVATDAPADSNDKTGVDDGAISRGGQAAIVATINQRQLPSRKQITAAILESSKVRARELNGGASLDVARPFSVFSRMEVKQIRVKHESGSVILEISESMYQEDGRILAARTTERELSIRRSEGVWIISDHQGRTYLGEENALEIFERQAEVFLRRAPNSSSTRIVVKALDRLYDHQSDSSQRAAIQ